MAQVEDDPLDVFILAGQSNMAGRGGTFAPNDNGRSGVRSGVKWDGVVPPACAPSPKVYRLSASREWEQAAEPLHEGIDTDKACGIGPGMAFANHLLSMGYGLVPCAVGGTCIDQWAEGEPLRVRMFQHVEEALKRPGARLAGLLWYQGESDCDSEARAESYQDKLVELFTAVRVRLGDPDLPVIQVAVHTTREALPFVGKIREIQLSLDMRRVATVDAGCYHLPDNLHLSSSAQCRLGRDMAEAFAEQFCGAKVAHL